MVTTRVAAMVMMMETRSEPIENWKTTTMVTAMMVATNDALG